VITPQAAKKMLADTGCAGVSIGRGAFYDPWIFKRTLHYLQNTQIASSVPLIRPAATFSPTGGESRDEGALGLTRSGDLPPEPSFAARVRVMCRHLDLMIEVFGEELGCRMFRKVAPWYAKRFGPANMFNKRVVHVSTRAEFQAVLTGYQQWRQQFLDEHGELLPRFEPPAMVASFMREPDAATRSQIPVPKGPVEVW
jgi:tRNA-dihydrouridine synthase B